MNKPAYPIKKSTSFSNMGKPFKITPRSNQCPSNQNGPNFTQNPDIKHYDMAMKAPPQSATQVKGALLPAPADKAKILELAVKAVEYARSKLPLKAPNKYYWDTIPEKKNNDLYSFENVGLRDQKLGKLRVECQSNGYVGAAERITTYGVGNCAEQAILAADFLSRELDPDKVTVGMFSYDAPGDHVFVAIGAAENPESPNSEPGERIQKVIICDPWANIACGLESYEKVWSEQMERWTNRGLVIGPPKGAISPNTWANAPLEHNASPFFLSDLV